MDQPFASPGEALEALEHHGIKGMRWGVRKQEEHDPRQAARSNEERKQKMSKTLTEPQKSQRQKGIDTVTRNDHQQVKGAKKDEGKHGLSRNQKMLLTFGALTAAGAGYYAYTHYVGSAPPVPHIPEGGFKQEARVVKGVGKLPAKWDVRALKDRPISTQKLGDLAGGEFAAKLHDAESLVIKTDRGYADILPKMGFPNRYAAEQHDEVVRTLEHMRKLYPSIRNMNVEVVPASYVPGMEHHTAFMSVMSMRAGEARIIYNDTMAKPSAELVAANKDWLPGLGHKDYLGYHEMGHLLAVAHGELPPGFDIVSGNAGPMAIAKWKAADSVLHKEMFAKHGFTFKELSKLSQYAATEPAEAMAELHGHLMQPEMRKKLTTDQVVRATAMFKEMGGLT